MTLLVSLNPTEVGYVVVQILAVQNIQVLSVIMTPIFSFALQRLSNLCPSWIKYILLIVLISSPNVLPPLPLHTASGVQLKFETFQPCHYLWTVCRTGAETFRHFWERNHCCNCLSFVQTFMVFRWWFLWLGSPTDFFFIATNRFSLNFKWK